MTHPTSEADVRCGTCKRWRPHKKRDRFMDDHYGVCKAPVPTKIPSAYGVSGPFDSASTAGDNCPAWKAGGKHGELK